MADMRTLVAWWNIFYNYKILQHIFEYLKLNEQIKLLDVCDTFEFVVTKIIWKEKFQTLRVYQTPYVTIITDATKTKKTKYGACQDDAMELKRVKETKFALKFQQCKKFLVANATNVQRLSVYSEYYDFKGSLGVTLNKIQMFRNLVELSYHKMVVTNEQVALIAEHCDKLRKLYFEECSCSELEALTLGETIKLESFISMSRLESLIIKNDASLGAPQNEMDSEILLDLLNGMKLKCLILKNITIVDSWIPVSTDVKLVGSTSLETLDIGCISVDFWPKFRYYLKNCSNLKDLSIKVANCNTAFNNQLVEILTGSAPQLRKLSLENCDLTVDNFCVFENLKELSLTSCGGLTFANLQEIMGGLQLERFVLINTRVLGLINHIYVSPSLQSITIDTILFTIISEAFEKSLNKFENLHTLNWLNGDINDNWIIDKCPNLKVLNIPNPYLLRRVVFTMKSLEEFTFTSCKGLSWRFIWILVKNMNLKRLNLQTHDTINDNKEIPEGASNTLTTLEEIIIPFSIFQMALEFWLDLMDSNRNLKIIFYGSHVEVMNTNFIYNLMKHRHRPHRLRSLKICGFEIDFLDLHYKFMEVLQQLNTNTSHYRTRNQKFTIEI